MSKMSKIFLRLAAVMIVFFGYSFLFPNTAVQAAECTCTLNIIASDENPSILAALSGCDVNQTITLQTGQPMTVSSVLNQLQGCSTLAGVASAVAGGQTFRISASGCNSSFSNAGSLEGFDYSIDQCSLSGGADELPTDIPITEQGGGASAVAGGDGVQKKCRCQLAIDSNTDDCEEKTNFFIDYGTSISPSDILMRYGGSCPEEFRTTIALTQELQTKTTVTEQNCENYNPKGAFNNDKYKYEISACSATEYNPADFAPQLKKNDSAMRVVNLVNPIGGTEKNPRGNTNWNEIIGKILKAGLGLIGSVTLIVFIYGGLQWLLSRGNSEMVKKGLDAMLYAGIGLFIIFSSYAILDVIFRGLEDIK